MSQKLRRQRLHLSLEEGGSSAVHRYNGLRVLFLYTEIQTGDTSGIWIVGILESGFYLVLSCLYIL